jgi:hypothetical protein
MVHSSVLVTVTFTDRVRIKRAVDDSVRVTPGSFQHVFDFFARFAILRYWIRTYDV